MAILRMCPNAEHFREFYGGYHGTCGETALATALVCATPQLETQQQAIDMMLSLTHEMISLGWADGSGSTTTGRLRDELVRRKFTYDQSEYIQWQDPVPDGVLHPLLLREAGVRPVVLMITRAGLGLHAIDGSHAEAGVQGHFICVVGLANEGYVCNDGDNNAINQHLVIYPYGAIVTANVTGVIVVNPQIGAHMPLPTGWKDTGAELTNPTNQNAVVLGFRDFVLNAPAWDADDVPLQHEEGRNVVVETSPEMGPGTRQVFAKTVLGYTAKQNVFKIFAGAELLHAEQTIKDLEAQLAVVKTPPITAEQKAAIVAVESASDALRKAFP